MGEGTLRLVLDTQRARRDDPDGLTRRQRDRLAELVAFARRTSPAYRTRYRGLPDLVEDSTRLPVVDKTTLMGEFDNWVTDPTVTASAVQAFVDDPARIGQPFLGRYTVTTTSGTTGTSGLFLLDRASLNVAGAVMLRALTSWLTGHDLARIVRARGRIAMIMATGGHFASAVAAARLRTTPARRRRIAVLSVHQPISELVDSLNRFQPVILTPYAGIAALLADEQHAGRLGIRPALVVLAAAGLSPSQYGRIVSAFPTAAVVSSYAATECPFLSVSCPDGWLHVNSDWAILEPVTADHRPVPAGELSDTVLLTNLANRIQPILRYDLGDRILQRPDPCPCRSPFPAIQVHGRVADLLTFTRHDGDPAAIPSLAFTTLADRTPGIGQVQIVQPSPDQLLIRLRTRTDADPDRAWTDLAAALRRLLDDHGLRHITVRRDHQPPRATQGGKYRTVIPLTHPGQTDTGHPEPQRKEPTP